ncbi:MAG: hypothetical protein WC422_00340 [Candidatus Paceibacterota bacterium]|jgi:hypothetical protein
MRIRTNVSNSSVASTAEMDFAGVSFRYIQANSAPIISNPLFNNQQNIVVSGYGTTPANIVYVTADVTDADGCSTLSTPTGCAFRSGSSYSDCVESHTNENETLSCSLSNCSGGSDTTATISCAVTANYLKDPTDAGTP